MSLRCVICGSPDPDVDDGRCMDCISAGTARREETMSEGKQQERIDWVTWLDDNLANEEDAPFERRAELMQKAFDGFAAQPAAAPVAASAELRAKADKAYRFYVGQMRRDECLGYEEKLKLGKFGKKELDAHTRAAELLGRHRAFMEAVALTPSPVATKETLSDGEDVLVQGKVNFTYTKTPEIVSVRFTEYGSVDVPRKAIQGLETAPVATEETQTYKQDAIDLADDAFVMHLQNLFTTITPIPTEHIKKLLAGMCLGAYYFGRCNPVSSGENHREVCESYKDGFAAGKAAQPPAGTPEQASGEQLREKLKKLVAELREEAKQFRAIYEKNGWDNAFAKCAIRDDLINRVEAALGQLPEGQK